MTPEQRAEADRIIKRIDSLGIPHPIDKDAATLLRALAAQQAQADPVAPAYLSDGHQAFPAHTVAMWPERNRRTFTVPLYTDPVAAPAARVDLTDERLYAMWDAYTPKWPAGVSLQDFVQIGRLVIAADRGITDAPVAPNAGHQGPTRSGGPAA